VFMRGISDHPRGSTADWDDRQPSRFPVLALVGGPAHPDRRRLLPARCVILAAIGFLVCMALYLAAIYAIGWSARRRAQTFEIAVESTSALPSPLEIWHRHTVEWTILFSGFFFVLALASFPLWQCLGIAGLLALIFGSLWLSHSPPGPSQLDEPRFRRNLSGVWYWGLAVADWFGYLGSLCCFTALIVAVI
jgi:hypothetical protein